MTYLYFLKSCLLQKDILVCFAKRKVGQVVGDLYPFGYQMLTLGLFSTVSAH